MDRGTNSIISLLNQILFQIAPVLVDIAIAVIYFIVQFDWVFGVIVFLTMGCYILFTIWITEWRTKFRREMIELDNDSRAKAGMWQFWSESALQVNVLTILTCYILNFSGFTFEFRNCQILQC